MDLLDEILAQPELAGAWRAPTPGEHVCVGCAAAACFGFLTTWYCRACVPPGFLPNDRGQR